MLCQFKMLQIFDKDFKVEAPLLIFEMELKGESLPFMVEHLEHLQIGEIKAKVEYKLDYIIINRSKFDVGFR